MKQTIYLNPCLKVLKSYAVIPLIKVSTKSSIRFKILSPNTLRCNKLGFSPSIKFKTSSLNGSLSANR